MSPFTGADQLSRTAARELARRELERQQYQTSKPSLLSRALGSVLHSVSDAFDRASGHVPGGGAVLVVVLVLLLGLVVLLLRIVRPSRDARSREALFDQGSGPLSPDGHRRAAEQAAARGEFADAVRERLRAVVRELEERGVLDPRPGRTAAEVAAEAGSLVPALLEPLRRGTRLFDEVWYGGQTADPDSYADLVAVDREVTQTRMVMT